MPADRRRERGRKPVEVEVERLKCVPGYSARDGGGKQAAGAKREQRRRVAGANEAVGQENCLSFGSPAAQKILQDENFHCPGRWRGEGMRVTR